MANENSEIKTYGAIRCKTAEGKAAFAQQVFDEQKGKFINEINQNVETKSDTNSTSIEGKVNAIIDTLITVIQNVVWWGGVPYNVPQQLLSDLHLLRIGNTSTTTALCGSAICGQAICGTN